VFSTPFGFYDPSKPWLLTPFEKPLHEYLAERAACAERLRAVGPWNCEKPELEAAIKTVGAGGNDAADAWLWLLTLVSQMPIEVRSRGEECLGDLHQAGERWFIASNPDLISRLNSRPNIEYDA
jgi:hypothetical protein